MKTIVSQKMSRGQGNEFLNKLETAGLNGDLAQRVIDSKGNELAAKVVRLIQNGRLELRTSPETNPQWAKVLMGKNFFGVEEAIKYFGVNPSKQQLAILDTVPFTEEMLRACRDTHILVAVFPMSILDIRGKVERKLFSRHESAWYNKQSFAKDKGEVGWQLVCKVHVDDSEGKDWNEQQALLSQDEETPKARVMVYTIIGCFLQTGERLFNNTYVRCADLCFWIFREHVSVGFFVSEGLDFPLSDADAIYVSFAITSAKKQ